MSSMMRSVRLCGSACALPLTHDAPWLKWDVSELMFQFFELGRLTWNRGQSLLLTRQESCRRLSDLGQSASRLHLDNCDFFDWWQ